jgi:pimeloyl-ACP methyl ester carboxylesterase
MPYVLIHGGSFAASCWDRLVPLLPPPAHAIDLPGRGGRPRPVAGLTIADFVDAVVHDIEASDLHDVVLVGHSMAGITMPGVAARVPERLKRLVFVSCTVPADGTRILDELEPDVRALAEVNALDRSGGMLDEATARAMFCDGMDDDTTRFTLASMVPEAVQVTAEAVSLAGLTGPAAAVPRTWIRLDRDVVVSPSRQDTYAERVGADVISLDAGHMAMISHPQELAALLRPLL